MKLSSIALLLTLFQSCTGSNEGRVRTNRETIDLWTFSSIGSLIFDSVSLEDLRGIHLAGTGLINRDVLVKGTIESTGAEGTYMIIVDSTARMLVDTTKVSSRRQLSEHKQGKVLLIHGEVKSGENGHIYLVANAIRGG